MSYQWDPQLTRSRIKKAAKELHKLLKDSGIDSLGHSQCINVISKAHGFKCWNVASAVLDSGLNPIEYAKKMEEEKYETSAHVPYPLEETF